MLLAFFINAADPVKSSFDRPQIGERNVRSPLKTRVMYKPSGLTSATTIAQ